MATERGYTVCRNGGITRGPQVSGDSHSVSIPINCPSGSKPAALFHTHPGGDLAMSPQDIRTMKEKGLPVCIRVGNRVKCYRPKRK